MPLVRSRIPPLAVTAGPKGPAWRAVVLAGTLTACGLTMGQCTEASSRPSPPAAAARVTTTTKDTKMQMTLSLPAAKFVVSEAVLLTVTFTNNSSAPRNVPVPISELNTEPTFTIKGPPFPLGRTFNPRLATIGDGAGPSPGPSLQLLAPGQSLQGQLPLHHWAPLSEPGTYEIVASYHEDSQVVTSPPLHFTVEAIRVLAASVAVDVGGSPQRTRAGAALLQGERDRRLYRASYTEKRPDLGEMSPPMLSFLQDVPAAASAVYVPYSNYDRSTSFHHWFLFREGAALCGRALLSPKVGCFSLPEPLNSVARPALLTVSGNVDVFLFEAGGKEVALVRFPPPRGEHEASAPTLLWRHSLKGAIVSARAALSAPPASERHLVVASQVGDGVEVHHLSAGGGEKVVGSQSFLLRGVRAVPGSEPGLTIDRKGTTHVSLILESENRALGLVIVGAKLGPDGQWMGSPVADRLGIQDEALRAAAIGYPVDAETPLRRDWVLMTGENKIYGYTFGRGPSQQKAGEVVLPLELLALTRTTYFLTQDPLRGAVLEKIHP